MQCSGDSILVLSSHFSFNSIGTFFSWVFNKQFKKTRPTITNNPQFCRFCYKRNIFMGTTWGDMHLLRFLLFHSSVLAQEKDQEHALNSLISMKFISMWLKWYSISYIVQLLNRYWLKSLIFWHWKGCPTVHGYVFWTFLQAFFVEKFGIKPWDAWLNKNNLDR